MSSTESAIRNKKRREDFKALGLCVLCGKNQTGGLATCTSCRSRQNRASRRERRAELNRKYRKKKEEDGICSYCKEKAIAGLRVCERHRRKKSEYNKNYTENKSDVVAAPPSAVTLQPVVLPEVKTPWWKLFDSEPNP